MSNFIACLNLLMEESQLLNENSNIPLDIKKMKKQSSISKAWDYLAGSRSDFILEDRILNSAGVLSMLALLVFIVYDGFFIVSQVLAVVTAATFVVQLFFYYFSRFKKQFKLARLAFTLGSYIFIGLNFLYSAGIDGPTFFGFFLTFIVIITINDRKYHWLLIGCHSFLGFALLYFQYHNSVISNYKLPQDRYIDTAATYFIMLGLMFVLIRSVIGNYKRERVLATERAIELETLHAEKNRLFSIISHDLRSPLNSIQGYLEMLSEHSLEKNERDSVERQLLALTKGTSDMLHNLLTWSKAQLEGTLVNVTIINLAKTVTPTLVLLQQIAERKSIKLTYDIDSEIELCADTEMLQLVVRNLIYNSIKFTNPSGFIQVDAGIKGDNCIINVRDNGYGIADDKKPQVFTTKIQSTPGTGNEKGIGLGLLLCYDFIRFQGGDIWFSSQIGVGSIFSISLPIR